MWTNESVIKLLIAHFSPKEQSPSPTPCNRWNSEITFSCIGMNVSHRNLYPPALISHRSFGKPFFQAMLCRCMTVFEIPAPINHCSVTCFTPYLLSSFSSVLDCQCCVNCLLFWCSICSAFWQAPAKCSQLTFGQQTQWTFLTRNLMPTYVFPCSLFQAALLTVITWSHLASVVTVEWKQLSHKPEHCFQLLLFFLLSTIYLFVLRRLI